MFVCKGQQKGRRQGTAAARKSEPHHHTTMESSTDRQVMMVPKRDIMCGKVVGRKVRVAGVRTKE